VGWQPETQPKGKPPVEKTKGTETMLRLIDANALKKENDQLLHCDFPYLSETTLEELIDDAPTIDAEPVRHGKWIDEHCSECGEYVYHGDTRNYCPNCGARMDEE
jgi:formylmethanofuran dehydrogenase subunit E